MAGSTVEGAMRLRDGWIGVLALGVVGCSYGPSAPVAPEPIFGPYSVIEGTVIDEETEMPAGAGLVILQSDALPEVRETVTNEEGRYAFRDLPPGNYTVQVLYGQSDVSRVVALSASVRHPVDFSVDPSFVRHCCCCLPLYDPWASMLESDETEQRLMGNDPPVIHPTEGRPIRL